MGILPFRKCFLTGAFAIAARGVWRISRAGTATSARAAAGGHTFAVTRAGHTASAGKSRLDRPGHADAGKRVPR